MPIPTHIREELIRLCSREGTRTAVFTKKAPTKWHPTQARDPKSNQPYTRNGAWERVLEELRNGTDVNPLALDHPPGKTAYVFHFADARGVLIYVKLQIGSGTVLGRSFHEDEN